MHTDSLGDRMKRYELATRYVLPPQTYTIIRVDGRAFHTYLKHAQKPFDMDFVTDMGLVAAELCQEIQGAVFAYHQSDEISVLVRDNMTLQSEPWFGGVVQKMASVSASIATASFFQSMNFAHSGTAHFDSRVYTIPSYEEVAQYFLWRQRDAIRNSISMAAQACFSHAELQGKKSGEMQEMLWSQHSINWGEDYPASVKRGQVVTRINRPGVVTYNRRDTGEACMAEVTRTVWDIKPAPIFLGGDLGWFDDLVRGYCREDDTPDS